MAVTAGVGGSVKWNSVLIANIDQWTLSVKGGIAKTTSFGATGSYETNLALLKDWTATCSGRFDPNDATGQLVLLNGLGTSFTLLLTINGTNGWSGPAIVTGLDPKASVSSTVDINISFEGDGAVAYA